MNAGTFNHVTSHVCVPGVPLTPGTSSRLWFGTRRQGRTSRALNWKSGHVSPKHQFCVLTPATTCRDRREVSQTPSLLTVVASVSAGAMKAQTVPETLRSPQTVHPVRSHAGPSPGELTLGPLLECLFTHPACITGLARSCFFSPGYRSLHAVGFLLIRIRLP